MVAVVIYLLLLFIPLLFYGVLILWKKNNFFRERGIKHFDPYIIFGNLIPMFLMKKSVIEVMDDLRLAFPDEPITGYYNFTIPSLLIQSAEYAEKVLIKDFAHFTNRGMEMLVEKTQHPFDESLFTMTGKRWRAFRCKLSPMFTTGKLRGMFPLMGDCAEELVKHLNDNPKESLDMKKSAGMFSLDVIGSTIFGIETKVIENPDSDYHRLGKWAFDMTFLDFCRIFLIGVLPGFIVRRLGLCINKKDVVEYFSKIVNDTLKYRRENNVQRNDLIQLLLRLKENERIEVPSWDTNDDYLKCEEIQDAADYFEISDDTITVQAFSFLVGGYDLLSLTITYVCFELAQHFEIQERVRYEIREQIKLNDGFNFEAVKNMTLLENCVKEALRLYPVSPSIMRICTKDYTFPNGYRIRKGEVLQIPPRGIHRNPKYFEQPDTFRPERFYGPIKPATFLPFGEGPRICLAMRYAILNTKIGVAKILMNYRLKLNPKTEVPMKIKPLSFMLSPRSEILFDLDTIVF